MEDDLMEDLKNPELHEVYFQFDNDEPVKFATVAGDKSEDVKFSLTLKATETDEPRVTFSDGNGKSFKLYMKQLTDGIQ